MGKEIKIDKYLSRKEAIRLIGLVGAVPIFSACNRILNPITTQFKPEDTPALSQKNTPFQPELPTVTLTPESTQTLNPTETATPKPISCNLENIVVEIKEKGFEENHTVPILSNAHFQETLEGQVDLSRISAHISSEIAKFSSTGSDVTKKVVLPEYIKPSDIDSTNLTYEVESYKQGMDLTQDGTFLAAVHAGKNGLTIAFWQMPVLEKRSDGTDKVNGVLYVLGNDAEGSKVFMPVPNQMFIDQKYKRTYPDIAVTKCGGAIVRVEIGTDYEATYVFNPEGDIVNNENTWIPLQSLRPYETEYNIVTEKETVNTAELDPRTRLLIVLDPETGKYDVTRNGTYTFEWNKWGRVLSATNEQGEQLDAYLFTKWADQKLGWAGTNLEVSTFLNSNVTVTHMDVQGMFTGNIKEFYNIRINGTLYNYLCGFEFLVPTGVGEFTPYYLPSYSYFIREGTVRGGTQMVEGSLYEFSSAIKTLQERSDSTTLSSLTLDIDLTGSCDDWNKTYPKGTCTDDMCLMHLSVYDFIEELRINKMKNNIWPAKGGFLAFTYIVK